MATDTVSRKPKDITLRNSHELSTLIKKMFNMKTCASHFIRSIIFMLPVLIFMYVDSGFLSPKPMQKCMK